MELLRSLDLSNGLFLLVGFIVGWFVQFVFDWLFWSRRNRALQDDNDQLQSALNRALNDKSGTEQQLGRTTRRAEMAEEKVSNLHHQLKAVDDQRIALDDELTQTGVRLRQMTAVEQANESLRNKLTQTEMKMRDVENDYSKTNSQLSSEQARSQVVTDEASTLRSSLDNSELELERLAQDKAILRQRLADSEAQVATLNAQLDRSQQGEGSFEDEELRLQLDSANSEIHTLRSNMAAVQLERGGGGEAGGTGGRAGGDNAYVLEQRIESLETELVTRNNEAVASEVKLQNMADALTDERMKGKSLERRLAETDSAESGTARLDHRAQQDALERENTELRRRLAVAEAARSNVPLPPTAAAPASTTMGANSVNRLPSVPSKASPDKLQEITGIGSVYAKRFNDAGVTTFAQLVKLSPARIREVVQAKEFQNIDIDGWIAQASEFANKS